MSRLLLALTLSSVLCAGCGPKGDGKTRHAVAGTVRLAAKPLDSGTILFNPTDPTAQGGTVQGAIKDGKYAVEVPPGTWRVTFAAGIPAGVNSSGPPVKAEGPVIPPRYRDGIAVEVAGPDPTKDFDLKAK